MNRALAAVFEGNPGRLVMRDLPVPEPQSGEMLVNVLGCTLCGSDLHSFEGRRTVPVPTILGHEIVGEIADLGEAAPVLDMAGEPLRIGDRVTWAIVANCGECFYCRRDLPQKCERGVKYGHEPFRPGRELLGGLAERCLLVAGTSVVRLPDELPLETACPASCATATIVAALDAAGDVRDRTVVVLGAGMLGLTACAMAGTQGARDVIAVDLHVDRRALAVEFGATRAVTLDGLPEAVDRATGGHGADVILELTGSPAVFQAALPLARLGGKAILVGAVFPAEPVPLALDQLVRRNLSVDGVHNYAPWQLLTAVRFLTAHRDRFPWAQLVGQWHPLSDVAAALCTASNAAQIRLGVRPT